MRPVRARESLVAAALAPLLLLAASSAASSPLSGFAVPRHQNVGGFRIEALGEEDGGRLVRMSRRGPRYRFEYHLEFWRGNGGVVVGAAFRRGGCRSGDADLIQPTADAMSRANLDYRLSEYLRECPLSLALEKDLRRGLDAAWPLFSAWAGQALDATEAENAAIANEGREP